MKDMERLVRKINNLERIVRSLKAEGSAGQISSDTSVYQLDFTHQHPLSGISNLSKLAGTLLTYSSEVLSVDEASIDHGSIAGLADEDHSLSAIANTTGDKTFTFANKGIKFLFTGVNPGAYDGMFELEMTGNLQADIMHIHQHTGNVVAGSKLLHLHGEDSDLLELEISGQGLVFSIQDTGDSDEELLAFDTTARTLRIGAADGNDDIALSIYGQIVALDGFGAIDINFAGGTTYKVEADGTAVFKDVYTNTVIAIGDNQHRIVMDAAGNSIKIYPGDEATDNFFWIYSSANAQSQPQIMPEDDNEGTIGDVARAWYQLYINEIYAQGQVNFASGTTYKVEADGTAFFKEVSILAGNLLMSGAGGDDERLKLPYLTGIPASVDNGSIWMEADGLHIYYNGAEKLVAGV